MFYCIYLIIAFLLLFLLYPNNFNEFINTNTNAFNFIAYFIAMAKILMASVLIGILGIIFLSGFYYMISEALITGRTSKLSFLPGIKKYFVRTLLSTLLLYSFSIALSILLSIIVVAVVFTQILGGSESVTGMSIFIMLLTTVIVAIPMPFVLLWFPSIFIDDIGVIQGLKRGAKAGVKNYWKLLLILFIFLVPVGIIMAMSFSKMTNGNIFTPGTMAMYLVEAAISIVVSPTLFIIYQGYRQSEISRDVN